MNTLWSPSEALLNTSSEPAENACVHEKAIRVFPRLRSATSPLKEKEISRKQNSLYFLTEALEHGASTCTINKRASEITRPAHEILHGDGAIHS